MEQKELNLYQKLAKIRALTYAAEKTKEGYGYSYIDINEVLAKVTGGMTTYGVSLMPKISERVMSEKQDIVKTKPSKNGVYEAKSVEYLTKGFMEYVWINDDDPREKITVPWYFIGSQADPSQAYGTAMTYALRQFLCNFFQIAQTDYDVEQYRKNQKEAEVAEAKAICKTIINELDQMVLEYLKTHEKDKEKVKKLLSKYAPGAKYKGITDPEVATDVLKDFVDTFITQETQENPEPEKKESDK